MNHPSGTAEIQCGAAPSTPLSLLSQQLKNHPGWTTPDKAKKNLVAEVSTQFSINGIPAHIADQILKIDAKGKAFMSEVQTLGDQLEFIDEERQTKSKEGSTTE